MIGSVTLFIGGAVMLCAMNIYIWKWVLREKRVPSSEDSSLKVPVEMDEEIAAGFRELEQMLREGLRQIAEERESLNAARSEYRQLLDRGRKQMEELRGIEAKLADAGSVRHWPEARLPREEHAGIHREQVAQPPRRTRECDKICELFQQGYRIEEVAQQMEMTIGELKLRLALWEKEGALL
ncbi:MAG: hypothetical protein GF333_05120 [Candidatus Omnitrophica bacterium]|nr:hypothetical protein [Candidatus Omnitrophota bacterium]